MSQGIELRLLAQTNTKEYTKKIASRGHFQPRGWLLSLRRKDFMLKCGIEMFSSVAQSCLTLCDIFGIECSLK